MRVNDDPAGPGQPVGMRSKRVERRGARLKGPIVPAQLRFDGARLQGRSRQDRPWQAPGPTCSTASAVTARTFRARTPPPTNPDYGDMNAPNITLLPGQIQRRGPRPAVSATASPGDGREFWFMPVEGFRLSEVTRISPRWSPICGR